MIELSFKESMFGVKKTISINKQSACDVCSGVGAKTGTKMTTCNMCGGKGKIERGRRSILGSFAISRYEITCKWYTGKIPTEKCLYCHGAGVYKKQQEIDLNILQGLTSEK
jgi:molecular chaperone DnaJ